MQYGMGPTSRVHACSWLPVRNCNVAGYTNCVQVRMHALLACPQIPLPPMLAPQPLHPLLVCVHAHYMTSISARLPPPPLTSPCMRHTRTTGQGKHVGRHHPHGPELWLVTLYLRPGAVQLLLGLHGQPGAGRVPSIQHGGAASAAHRRGHLVACNCGLAVPRSNHAR